jgi:hypothetical protein
MIKAARKPETRLKSVWGYPTLSEATK